MSSDVEDLRHHDDGQNCHCIAFLALERSILSIRTSTMVCKLIALQLLALAASIAALTPSNLEPTTRRGFAGQVITSFITTGVGLSFNPSLAAASTVDDDKSKILQGFERLNYLLDNWEKETTVCGVSDNPYTGNKGCERTPLKVMEYMGYKSMKDPLFKADKTLKRLSAYVPTEYESDYLNLVEKWAEAAEEASGMAYISSWGEANPGGGKDRVEYFIERAKKNVTDARDSLESAISILKIK
jgi:hypothetical protein